MFNPSNPCAFRSENLGGNDAMQFGCVDITSEGGSVPEGVTGSVSVDNQNGEVNVTGYDQVVFALRGKVTVNSLINTRDTIMRTVTTYAEEKAFIRIWKTRDFTKLTEGNSAWEDYGDGHIESIQRLITGGTMVFDTTGLKLIFGSRVPKDSYFVSHAEGQNFMTPGDMFVYTMHRENGAAIDCGCTIEFAEEI